MNRRLGPGGAPRRSFPVWKALVVAALVVELVVIVVLIRGRGDVVTTDEPKTASPVADRFEDPDVPYSFAYPEEWEVENDGAVTKLLSPGNEIAIAVGPAPAGDVLASSDRLVEGVSERYADAETKDRKLTRVGGNLGLTVTGTAVNEFGVQVRFAIVTIEGERGNYAITQFAAGTGEGAAERALQEVVDDFEIVSS